MGNENGRGMGSYLVWGAGGAVGLPMLILLVAALIDPHGHVGDLTWTLFLGFVIGLIARFFFLTRESNSQQLASGDNKQGITGATSNTRPSSRLSSSIEKKTSSSSVPASTIQRELANHNVKHGVQIRPAVKFALTDEAIRHALTLTVRFESEAGGTFQIPACGQGGIGEYYPFDWNIDWGDGTCERVRGVSSSRGGDVSLGSLVHAFGAKGRYEIAITPAEQVSETTGDTPGWLQAFGYPESWAFSVDDNQRFVEYVFPKGGDKLVCVDGVLDDYAINIELEGACAQMFIGCKNITMGSHFTISSNKETAGDHFCFKMFSGCSGDAFTMGDAFKLPQGLCEVGKAFCCKMFASCSGPLFTMNDEFTIPQGINITGNFFCQEMFADHGSGLTMGKSFNLPQGIEGAGNNFCTDMFTYVGGKKSEFTMNDVFNLPPHISGHVGNSFCDGMFRANDSDTFRMNDRFNLPQGITSAGDAFCKSMFLGCSGSSFAMNGIFTMPSNLQEVGEECCMQMFYGCNGAGFHVADGFNLPYVLNGQGRLCLNMFGNCRYTSLNWNVQDIANRNPSLGIWSPSLD